MKICENCGFELEEDSTYCENCGKLIDKGILSTQMMLSSELVATGSEYLGKKIFEKNPVSPRLCIEKGGTDGREFPLTKDICNIGRWDPILKSHPEVDLSDEDINSKVSRIHARIIKKDEGFYLEDMGSKNGTFLNREYKLVDKNMYKIKNNDEIIIGNIFFRFKM